MAYEVVMSYHLHMPSYFLGTFTEYPYLYANSALSLGYLEMPMYSGLPCRTMSTSV